VQASSTNSKSLEFYQNNFNITRAVLPRVLSLSAVKELASKTALELEVFAFGSLCIMAEGRCYLSSYLTGQSPNGFGACSPGAFVEYKETDEFLETRLNDVLIDKFTKNESAGYPTLCKGRFKVDGELYHAIEEPVSLNTLDILPQLNEIGIACIKIEGRQRSPAYIAQITKVWREALDSLGIDSLDRFQVKPSWNKALKDLSEGESTTLGAYHRMWK
jgi:putative protease